MLESLSFLGLSILFLIFTSSLIAQQELAPSGAPQVDYSGVDAFWSVVDRLKEEETLSEQDWTQLFEKPYYKFYADWGQQAYMQKVFGNTFLPSRQPIRDSIINLNNWETLLLKHLLSVDTLRAELQEFRMQLEKRDLLREALKQTKVYLPKGLIKRNGNKPKVAFGFYQPDGNADASIAIDLKLAMDIDIVGFIAHEAHHYYAYKHQRKFKENDSTKSIVHAISQLQLEGVADLIDKEVFLKSKGEGFPTRVFETYQKHFNNPFPVLNQLDSLLVLTAEKREDIKKNGKQIKDLLPLAGHPHGYYMARIILKEEGKKALLKTIENPFAFIPTYNTAAKKTQGAFVFSDKAIDFLKKLEGAL